MKYAIVYSSKTGNTAALADRLHDILPHEHCVYFGDTSITPRLGADLIFAGFCTDKGSCDDRTRIFLKNLQNTKIALFGTAGYAAPDYIHSILKAGRGKYSRKQHRSYRLRLPGKMQPAVADKFAAMLERTRRTQRQSFFATHTMKASPIRTKRTSQTLRNGQRALSTN